MNKPTEKMKPAGAGLMRRPVEVTVRIICDDPEEFALESKVIPPIKSAPDKDPVVTFDNYAGGQYSDGFEITFTIVDETEKGYGFFQDPINPDPNDAMSVKIVDNKGHCPRRGETWEGFVPTEVSADQQALVVENPNGHLQYFGFALHFSLPGENKPSLTYDPIGDNKNGLPPLVHR